FSNTPATSQLYTLSLHDALPIFAGLCEGFGVRTAWQEGGDNDPVNQLAAYHVDLTIASFGIQEENHFPQAVHDLLPGTAELRGRSEEHTSELQSRSDLVCRLLLE